MGQFSICSPRERPIERFEGEEWKRGRGSESRLCPQGARYGNGLRRPYQGAGGAVLRSEDREGKTQRGNKKGKRESSTLQTMCCLGTDSLAHD